MYAITKTPATHHRSTNPEDNRSKQIIMLYDEAIKFLNLTAEDIEADDLIAKVEHSNRALDMISHLQSILDLEPDGKVAESLDSLYRSVTLLILRASARPDAALMRRAAGILAPVREAWATNARNANRRFPFSVTTNRVSSIHGVIG